MKREKYQGYNDVDYDCAVTNFFYGSVGGPKYLHKGYSSRLYLKESLIKKFLPLK